jgi:hypothetical protein
LAAFLSRLSKSFSVSVCIDTDDEGGLLCDCCSRSQPLAFHWVIGGLF